LVVLYKNPESAYQVNNSEITFANAPTAQDGFFCIALGVSLGIGVPGSGTVNGPQMAKPFNYDGFFYLNDASNRVGINSSIPTSALDVSGTIKASSFSGPIGNPSGISTFYDLRVTNNLTVEGTTTTLDTNLMGVDRIEVGADSNTIVGVAITQSGTADILNLYDGSTEVFSVADGGNVTSTGTFTITNAAPNLLFTETDGDPDWGILCSAGQMKFQDMAVPANILTLDSNKIQAVKNLDAMAGVDVTGNITATGEIKALTLFESTSGND